MTGAVVLAAGTGTRLADVSPVPKWLTAVRDTCPAAAHLAALERVGIRDVVAVVGEDIEAIASVVEPWRGRVFVDLVVNPHSVTRNNWYSLLLGIERWATSDHDDFLVINSDLFASVGWMEETMRRALSVDLGAALAVDRTRGHDAEAMKVVMDADGGQITRIGKVGIDSPGGEYVGLGRWNRRAGGELLAELRAFVDDPERIDDWYEHAIDEHLRRSGEYGVVPVPSGHWVEIDDAGDLARARALSA